MCIITGDPRRPYPLDIVMRRGALGQMSQQTHLGVATDDELAKSRHSSVVDEQSAMMQGTSEPHSDPYSTGMYLAILFSAVYKVFHHHSAILMFSATYVPL